MVQPSADMALRPCPVHPPPPVPEGEMNPLWELRWLEDGNRHFKDHINTVHPGLFERTAEGQHPPFLIIACSDSRVSEATIFSMLPGTVFAGRNVANQFHSSDTSIYATLAYAVAELGVNHVIVLGHYGCGGVKAAMSPHPEPPIDAAQGVVQAWIEPIRELHRDSVRPEIRAFREEYATGHVSDSTRDTGFRALVEENVRASVARIAASSVVVNHFAKLRNINGTTYHSFRTGEEIPATPVFIHGWVYDFANGNVFDLDVSVGPPGVPVPKSRFPRPSSC